MDKLERVIYEEQFIPKNILYGTIGGILVKDIIEKNADTFNFDELLSGGFADRVIDMARDNPSFIFADKKAKAPLPSDIFDPTDSNKKKYIEEYISMLPYSGEIYLTPDKKINIGDELRGLKINDMYQEEYGFGGESRPIDAKYRQFLLNEFIKPSFFNKTQAVISELDDLRFRFPDIDNVIREDPEFKELVNNINDYLKVEIDGQEFEISEYMESIYKRDMENQYNSVNSKPNMVELMELTRGENGLEVKNNYINLNQEELSSIISRNNNYTYNIDNQLRTLFTGVSQAKDSTLPLYEEMIVEKTAEAKIINPNNPLIDETVKELIGKKRQEAAMEDYMDDLELMYNEQMKQIREEYDSIAKAYLRTNEIDERRTNDLRESIINLKNRLEEARIPMHTQVDEINSLLDGLNIIQNNARDNVNHMKRRVYRDLEDRRYDIQSLIRFMLGSDRAPEIAGYEIRINNAIKEYNDVLEQNARFFNKFEIQELHEELERMLSRMNANYEVGRGRR